MMDKRSLLAIVLSFLILIGYQEILSHFYPPPKKPAPISLTQAPPPVAVTPEAVPTPPTQTAAAAKTLSSQEPASSVTATPLTGREVMVENAVYTAVFTSVGGRLKSLRLKRYPGDAGKDSPPRDMVQSQPQGELPLGVRLEGKEVIADERIVYEVSGNDIDLRGEEKATLTFTGKSDNGVTITKAFTFSGTGYGIDLTVSAEDAPDTLSAVSLTWTQAVHQQNDRSYQFHGPVALIDRKLVAENASKVLAAEQPHGPEHIRWAGYADTYFLAAMIPPEGDQHRLLFAAVEGTIKTRLTIPWHREPVAYTLYVGPKEFAALNAVHPALDRAIDFGWFHFIARPLVFLLQYSHLVTGNYGIDIILLTILVKLLFFPLANKSFQSMSAMKKLQPQIERLREQYQDDREKLNKETMELYRRYKVNPLGGCLPMLVQLPVFVGLYQALSHAIELRQAPFLGWIQDLSQPDRLGTMVLPMVEPPGLPVLTLLMGGTMFMQQAMTPATGDPMQQRMMMFMPLIFTFMFVSFPAGLVLYWLINNVLSIAQQYWYTQAYSDTRQGGGKS